MRPLILFVLIFFSSTSRGQELSRSDLSKIVELAFDQDKLPENLIVKSDSISFVVIKSENEIEEEGSTYKPNKINIWSDEQIFLLDPKYWMVRTMSTQSGKKAKIRYRTTSLGTRENEIAICYSGEIRALLDNGTWRLTKTRFKQTACEFDFWKRGK